MVPPGLDRLSAPEALEVPEKPEVPETSVNEVKGAFVLAFLGNFWMISAANERFFSAKEGKIRKPEETRVRGAAVDTFPPIH